MEIEEEINNNINKEVDSNEIKIEIINIYNLIINTYSDLEKPDKDIISFNQLLVKYLILNLNKDNTDELLIKIKKSLSLLLGLYINLFKSIKINHPIRSIFKEVLNYVIRVILFNEIKEDNKNEIENYYKYLLSIYNKLSTEKNESYLIDIQNSILYYSKQLIYEKIDNSEFKSPLDLKNINSLNDIDKKILFHPYLIKILYFLEEKNAKAFLGFFIRFLIASEKSELVCCKENIIICLNYFIKISWLPEEYIELVNILNNQNTEFEKIKKIIEFVSLYLKAYKLIPETSKIEIESKKAYCEKLKYLYKNIILENINVIN